MFDIFKEISSTMRQNKLRTALTGFSVAWGIFMLIALLGAGNGLLNAFLDNSMVLENSMGLYPGRTTKSYRGFEKGRRISFDDYDAGILSKESFQENVDDVSPVLSQNDSLSAGAYNIVCNVTGVMPSYGLIEKKHVLSGRFINDNDILEERKVLVLGQREALYLLPSGADAGSLVGKYVNVGSFSWKVVGIVQSDEMSGGSNVVYAPYSTVRTIYSTGNDIHEIYMTFHGLETIEENEAFENRYRRELNAHHSAAPDDEGTVYIWNRFTQNIQMNNVEKIIRTALWILGLFTLLSGIVGVSNIMLITVKERTHEFGIRKAIGAKPSSILRLIIVESVLITLAFGFIGMVFGLAANQLMDATVGQKMMQVGPFVEMHMFKDPTVGIDVAVEALITLIIAGTLAGLIPARKASRVKPVEALKEE